MFIDFTGKEISISCLSYLPNGGSNQQPRVCALTEIKPTDFWCTSRYSYQLTHLPRTRNFYFILQNQDGGGYIDI